MSSEHSASHIRPGTIAWLTVVDDGSTANDRGQTYPEPLLVKVIYSDQDSVVITRLHPNTRGPDKYVDTEFKYDTKEFPGIKIRQRPEEQGFPGIGIIN